MPGGSKKKKKPQGSSNTTAAKDGMTKAQIKELNQAKAQEKSKRSTPAPAVTAHLQQKKVTPTPASPDSEDSDEPQAPVSHLVERQRRIEEAARQAEVEREAAKQRKQQEKLNAAKRATPSAAAAKKAAAPQTPATPVNISRRQTPSMMPHDSDTDAPAPAPADGGEEETSDTDETDDEVAQLQAKRGKADKKPKAAHASAATPSAAKKTATTKNDKSATRAAALAVERTPTAASAGHEEAQLEESQMRHALALAAAPNTHRNPTTAAETPMARNLEPAFDADDDGASVAQSHQPPPPQPHDTPSQAPRTDPFASLAPEIHVDASPAPRAPAAVAEDDVIDAQMAAGYEAAEKARRDFALMVAGHAGFGQTPRHQRMSQTPQQAATPAQAAAAAAAPSAAATAAPPAAPEQTSYANALAASSSAPAKPKEPKIIKIQPDLAARLSTFRADGDVKHLPPQQEQMLLVGTKAKALEGHEAMVAYDLHGPYRTVRAMMEAASPWLKTAILRSTTIIMVTRERLGKASFLLLGGVKSANLKTIPKFDEGRVRVVALQPRTSPAVETITVDKPHLAKTVLYRLVGPKAEMVKFASTNNVKYAFERNFERNGKTQTHAVCALPPEKVAPAMKSLLVIPDECVTADESYSCMIVIDYLQTVTAEDAFAHLLRIQNELKIYTTLLTFKGRVCFSKPVTQEQLASLKTQYSKLAKNVRCPALGHVTLNRTAQSIADEDDVATAHVGDSSAAGSEILLLGVGENTSWISPDMVKAAMTAIQKQDKNAKVISQDGCFASVAVNPKVIDKFDNRLIQVTERIKLHCSSLKALKAEQQTAQKRREESLAKGKQYQANQARAAAAAANAAAPVASAAAPTSQPAKAPAAAGMTPAQAPLQHPALTPPAAAAATTHGS